MPTYEYACDSCGNGFEAFQKMSEAPLASCPECGQKIRRVLSGGLGISFKGSGFYVNDSASSSRASQPKGAAKDSGSASAGSASSCAASSCCAGCAASGS